MSEYLIQGETLTAIADAIRAKTGKNEVIPVIDMAAEIAGITAGGGTSPDFCYVTFMNRDGTKELGKKAVAANDDCADPITRGIFDTPTEESTAQYDFTWIGWATEPNGALDENALKAVSEDRVLYAAYASVLRYYTITYYDDDGTTVLKTESLAYGATPSYEPVKDKNIFIEWVPAPAAVTGNTSYTATWEAMKSFGTATWSEVMAIVESGQASTIFAIGDQRNVTYNGNNLTLEIIGFDHDELSDGSGKAGVTIWTKGIPETNRINLGTATGGGYGSSGASNYVNSTCLNKLPTEIVESIKEVKKYFFNGKLSASDQALSYTMKKAWLLSVTEIGAGDRAYNRYAEGTIYPYFDGTNEPRNKGASWWTRSVYAVGTNGTFSYVAADGSMSAAAATNYHGFVFGFCI